jgi:hypothetical protein
MILAWSAVLFCAGSRHIRKLEWLGREILPEDAQGKTRSSDQRRGVSGYASTHKSGPICLACTLSSGFRFSLRA